MATAVGVSGSSPKTVSDEERRWVIIGICLTKVLTPALRDVLANKMPIWYQSLLLPPHEIDKQTCARHAKTLPPSYSKLNYESVNTNSTIRKASSYDYAVKDPVSLAKLFMKPFMASFTGFGQTMDTSAALSIVAEAQPFHGASGIAKKIRSDVRNEWAHCNFSHWTDVNYQAALTDIGTFINNINLTPAEKKRTLDDLDGWKQKGLELCFGQPVDSELLRFVNTEVAELRESVKLWKEDVENSQVCVQSKLLNALETIEKSLKQEIQDLKERQLRTEQDVEQLKLRQLILYENVARKTDEEPRYIFMAPKQTQWFSGRESELDLLREILVNDDASSEEKVIIAAVSGLGGNGKTSLTAEYIHKWKNYYQGGVYWFSGEDDVKLKATVDDIAAQFNTLHENSLEATLSKTLAVFSRITKPWLMIIDDMDEFNLSQNVLKLVSGSWQANACFGHLIVTTRRTPQELKEHISSFNESRCLNLQCFGLEEAKNFVFKRTVTVRDEQTG
ncbi:Hypothetical predicted protein [Paramuricea clavata]|uniref:Uncharacterized protein n=1 Tax=Paramuricea clavata TaxID=317549 RepID=A0A7D9E7W5_PARCT|nr:Hypothetical predicted protein [Paramuricea clavata]